MGRRADDHAIILTRRAAHSAALGTSSEKRYGTWSTMAFAGRDMKINITIDTRMTKDINAAERSTIVSLCTEAHQVDFGALFSFLPPDGFHVLAYAERQLVG